MFTAGVDLHLLQLLAAKPVMGQHPFYRINDDPFGMLLAELLQGGGTGATWVATVAEVFFLFFLVPSDLDLRSIGYHDKIAIIQMGYEIRFMLATQDLGDPTGQSSKNLTVSIDLVPIPLNITRFNVVSLQNSPFFHIQIQASGPKKAA